MNRDDMHGQSPPGDSFELPEDLQYLASPDPMEILDRLCEEGAVQRLELYDRITVLTAKQGVLVSNYHLLEKWAAQLALHGYHGQEPFEEWLERRGYEALQSLMSEMEMEERNKIPVTRSQDFDFYQALSDDLGVDLANARKVCLAIHSLPLVTRQAFRAISLDERTVVDTCALLEITEAELADEVRRAFDAIKRFLDGGSPFDIFLPRDKE